MKNLVLSLKLLFAAFTLISLSFSSAFAQHTCGADEMNEKMWRQSPALKQMHDQMEARIYGEMRELYERQRQNPQYDPAEGRMVITIPVVYHIMHNPGEAVGTGSNITFARVQQEITNLNLCFRNLGAYVGGPSYSNAGVSSADPMINFCLATRDPIGFPTTGVTRHPFSGGNPLYKDDPGVDFGSDLDRDMKHISNWPTTDYMNVWVVDEICDVTGGGCGTAGYAYFPSAHGVYYDGPVMEADLVGSSTNNTKVMAHEIGHYLGLYHTFQATDVNITGTASGCDQADCLLSGDRVCDTPPENSTSSVLCPNTANTCSNDATLPNTPFVSDVQDIYECYMDYGFQSCHNTFTPGQVARMTSALNNERLSLQSSNGCGVTITNITKVAFSMTERTVAEYTGTVNDCRGPYRDINVRVKADILPLGNVTLTLNTGGTASEGVDYDLLTTSVVFGTTGDLFRYFTIRIYNDEAVEGNETLILTYTISGPASAASVNQTMTITIRDDDSTPTGPGNFVLYEDFEAGGTLSSLGWQISCFCGGFSGSDPNVWVNGSYGGMSGTYSAYVSSNPASQTHAYNLSTGVSDPLAITPTINATSLSNMTMSFDYKANGESGADFGLIYYQIGGSGPFSQLAGAGPFQGVTSSTNFSMTLPSSLDNTSFRLAFRWLNDYDGNGSNPGFTIDNFGISTPSTDVETDINLGVTSQEDSEYLGPYSTVYFYDKVSGDLMVKIENTSDHDFGCTTVGVERSETSAGANTVAYWNNTAGNYLHAKTFRVTPTNNTTGKTYNITLYYTQAEINNWLTATGKNIGDLKVVKYSGGIPSVSPPVGAGVVSNTEILNYNGSLATPNFGTTAYAVEATSSSGFSGFAIGDPGQPFPVDLLSFDATPTNDEVLLEWVTETEFNNDYFLVERSTDRNLFESIGKVEGSGTTVTRTSYQLVDRYPHLGVNYYRLKQVDFDGNVEYSNVVQARFTPESGIRVYPNPFSDFLTVELTSDHTGTAALRLYNAVGQLVMTENWNYQPNSTQRFQLPDLPNGVYLYEVNDGFQKRRGKLTK